MGLGRTLLLLFSPLHAPIAGDTFTKLFVAQRWVFTLSDWLSVLK